VKCHLKLHIDITLHYIVSAESDVQLSVVGVPGMANVSEGCDDPDNWRGVDREQQGTEHAALRNSVVAAD